MLILSKADWQSTVRAPQSQTKQDASSEDGIVASILSSNQISFRDRLYNILTMNDDYPHFSTQQSSENVSLHISDSLEALHNTLHGNDIRDLTEYRAPLTCILDLIGSGGHMTYPDYAAFDPIFFLHHAMVDRIFSIWQYLHPDSYVLPQKSTQPSFAIARGIDMTERTRE